MGGSVEPTPLSLLRGSVEPTRLGAVVMAAGEGLRLRPLTEHWPKPVLPIDGRPVVVRLVHELAAAGCAQIVVVTGHLAEQVEALLAPLPYDLRFVRQPRGRGSADAVKRAEATPRTSSARQTPSINPATSAASPTRRAGTTAPTRFTARSRHRSGWSVRASLASWIRSQAMPRTS